MVIKLQSKIKFYTCNACGRVFRWDKNSSWYGSYYDLEHNPEEIKYVCSEECKNNLII